MSRKFLQSFLVIALNVGLSSVGRSSEITAFRVVSSGQVEITFTSEAGALYDILGSEDLRFFSVLTRVSGTGERTQVLVQAPEGQTDRRFFRVRTPQLPPTPEWFRSYGGSGEESHGHYILACEDGGVLQVGETGFLPNTRILAIKLTPEGNLEWRQEYSNRSTGASGHGTYNLGNSVLEVEDGYWIAGAINRNSAAIKVNKDTGEAEFVRTHSNGGYDAYEHMVEIDGGLAAVGYTNAEDQKNTFFAEGRGYLAFLDSEGSKTGGRSLRDDLAQAYRIAKHGQALIVSGLVWNEDDNLDFGLLKLNADGSQVWGRLFRGHPG